MRKLKINALYSLFGLLNNLGTYQPAFTFSDSTTETVEHSVKYVQSYQ